MSRTHGLRTGCSLLVITFVVLSTTELASAQAGGGGGPAGGGSTASNSGAQAPATPAYTPTVPPSDPFYNWFEWKKDLEQKYGTKIGVNVDLTAQPVIAGPDTFTAGVARYDLSVNQQLWKGAVADLDLRGGWGDGPDPVIGNTVNTNQYAQTGSHLFVLHLWVQQKLLDDQLTLRGGKMDLGDWIDTNRFGTYNFVGYSFAHNSSIPLPGNPLAMMFTIEPKDSIVYVSAGVANGAQSSYVAGFEDLFDGNTALFAIGEVGAKTKLGGLDGVYRFTTWYDGRDLTPIDGGPTEDSRWGAAISFDQNLTTDFGLFARYGTSSQNEFTPQTYISAGFHWQGPIPSRKQDDLTIGFVNNIFSSDRDEVVANASSFENYVEAYYNLAVTPYLNVQPMLQVITNPGGVEQQTEVIMGVHVGLRF